MTGLAFTVGAHPVLQLCPFHLAYGLMTISERVALLSSQSALQVETNKRPEKKNLEQRFLLKIAWGSRTSMHCPLPEGEQERRKLGLMRLYMARHVLHKLIILDRSK